MAWVDERGRIVTTYDDCCERMEWDDATHMPVGAKAMVFDIRLRAAGDLVYTAKVAPAVEGSPIRESNEHFRRDLVKSVEAELLAARGRLLNATHPYTPKRVQPEVDQRRPSYNVNAIIGKSRDVVCCTPWE